MDRAEERARLLVDQYRPLFRDEVAHLAEGMIQALAGEIRGEARRVKQEAVAAADDALAAIRSIQT